MELNLRQAPKCLVFPKHDWWDDFDVAMDNAFIYPFDLRRSGGWRKSNDYPNNKVYWCYVIFPEGRECKS